MSGSNYSIHSIVAAYGLGLAPHNYYLIKMMANAKGQSSNILSVARSQYPAKLTNIFQTTRELDKPERQNLHSSLG